MRARDVSTDRPLWIRGFEIVALAGALVLILAHGSRVLHAAWLSGAWGIVLCTLPLGLAVADLVSGIVHWACDRFGNPRTRVLGPSLIAAFREHHVDPASILRHGFVERNGYNASTIVLPLALALLAWDGDELGRLALAAHSFLLFLTVGVLLTNEHHKWAHASRVPVVVHWLQRAGLILSPAHHAQHHRGTFTRRFCVTTGWLNPILDGFSIWTRAERWLRSRTAPGRLAPGEHA